MNATLDHMKVPLFMYDVHENVSSNFEFQLEIPSLIYYMYLSRSFFSLKREQSPQSLHDKISGE